MELRIKPIGYIKSPILEETDKEWGKVNSEIIIDEQYTKGLIGLKEFSHIMVVFYMHKAIFNPNQHLVRRPQERQDMPLIGIFAQRAKHRPNPLGVSSVELLGINYNKIQVKGLDAIDGTPVLDIKPYFPIMDAKNDVMIPNWIKRLMINYF
jgi:tRNA-Thr(GGU) m(6)t(6)A37 methyltransferase TsaA